MSSCDTTLVNLDALGRTAWRQAVTVEDVLTLTAAGSVTLSCDSFNAQAQFARLMAIQVGALHG